MAEKEFLSLNDITVRYLDKELFSNLTFTIRKGENWALVGASGSGKSALLNTIAGRFNIVNGKTEFGFFDEFVREHQIADPFFTHHKLVALVQQKHHFRNLSNTTDFYYQQRYNSFDSEDALIVSDYLRSIPATVFGKVEWDLDRVVKTMHLESLLEKQVIKLSNGETRRLLFAAALIRNPLLLLLDSPFTGMDVSTRAEYHGIIQEIIASGITVVMATSPSEIPQCITHVAILEHGKVDRVVPLNEFEASDVKIAEEEYIDDAELTSLLSLKPLSHYASIVKMDDVSVKYGNVKVLDSVNWHVQQGERWALMGKNGAGKSTLLSLINGDNPQAYSNHIILFDRRRGTGESIWDIKSKTGFVSPEMLQYFSSESSSIQIVESGFYDTMGLFRASNKTYAAISQRWMKLMGIGEFRNVPFKKLSASNQRLCLLARALVKNPPLLILDEPCQGLDQQQQNRFKALIDKISELSNITLIYVTHYEDELPACVTKRQKLEAGRVIESAN
jgi:molybdate transport system ATP-binding protein